MRTAILKCYRVDGEVIQRSIGTNQPSYYVEHLFKLFELKIATIEPKLGIELFTLEAAKVEDTDPEQEILWGADSCSLDDTSLAELLDRLANKIGVGNIHRYLPQERYWPEHSIKLALSLKDRATTTWRMDRPRPSLLLPRPERIEAAYLTPDNPPMWFIYKGERHTVKKADDAERIEPEWWLNDGPHRDYYVVEDEKGQRYWLFRSGHHGAENTPEWYIHGFFA